MGEMMLDHLSGLTQLWGYLFILLIHPVVSNETGLLHLFRFSNLYLNVFLSGYDVIAQAQSGTGKTATFAISILQQLDVEQKETQALVLAPTRELAQQVWNSFTTNFAKMFCFFKQKNNLVKFQSRSEFLYEAHLSEKGSHRWCRPC